jgi:hypothetical protein
MKTNCPEIRKRPKSKQWLEHGPGSAFAITQLELTAACSWAAVIDRPGDAAWLFLASITSQIGLKFHPRAGQKVRGFISLFFTLSLVETDARGCGGGPFNNSRDTVIAGRYINYKEVGNLYGKRAVYFSKVRIMVSKREDSLLWNGVISYTFLES